MLRFDAAFARYMAAKSRSGRVVDFMPWPRQDEPEATPEKLFLMFKNLASKSKKAN